MTNNLASLPSALKLIVNLSASFSIRSGSRNPFTSFRSSGARAYNVGILDDFQANSRRRPLTTMTRTKKIRLATLTRTRPSIHGQRKAT